MTYILTLERDGRNSVLFVEGFKNNPQGTFDMLVDGKWHSLKNVRLLDIQKTEEIPCCSWKLEAE